MIISLGCLWINLIDEYQFYIEYSANVVLLLLDQQQTKSPSPISDLVKTNRNRCICCESRSYKQNLKSFRSYCINNFLTRSPLYCHCWLFLPKRNLLVFIFQLYLFIYKTRLALLCRETYLSIESFIENRLVNMTSKSVIGNTESLQVFVSKIFLKFRWYVQYYALGCVC